MYYVLLYGTAEKYLIVSASALQGANIPLFATSDKDLPAVEEISKNLIYVEKGYQKAGWKIGFQYIKDLYKRVQAEFNK